MSKRGALKRELINTQDTRRIQGGRGTPLKTCPFCGAEDLRVWHLSITVNIACTRCGAHGPDIEIDWPNDDSNAIAAEAKAIEAWNKRSRP